MTELTITPKFGGPAYKIGDPGEGVIGGALRSGEPYEAKLLYHLQRQKLEGLAVDVGAGIGNHSLWLSLVCGLEVMAFEPIEYPRLIENVKLNNATHITVCATALGDEVGHATALGKGRMVPDSAGECMLATLDSFNLENVCLIKIDVEGMEPDVLRGAQQTIEHNRPNLYVEAANQKASVVIASMLKPLRYLHTKNYGATPLEEWIPCR